MHACRRPLKHGCAPGGAGRGVVQRTAGVTQVSSAHTAGGSNHTVLGREKSWAGGVRTRVRRTHRAPRCGSRVRSPQTITGSSKTPHQDPISQGPQRGAGRGATRAVYPSCAPRPALAHPSPHDAPTHRICGLRATCLLQQNPGVARTTHLPLSLTAPSAGCCGRHSAPGGRAGPWPHAAGLHSQQSRRGHGTLHPAARAAAGPPPQAAACSCRAVPAAYFAGASLRRV